MAQCRELRDYSFGQIAFVVFRALFAITQLLCHVYINVLLTCACKQAQLLRKQAPVTFCAPAERLL